MSLALIPSRNYKINMKRIIIAVAFLISTGCTNVQVKKLENNVDFICINKNNAVIVHDFLPAVVNEINRRGIETYIYEGNFPPEHCNYILTYTARKNWDFVMFMRTADINIKMPSGQGIGSAHYDCGSGLNFGKYKSTETKVKMMMDELLRGY
jgi:hypothetical protein